jgi:hypothetical protein
LKTGRMMFFAAFVVLASSARLVGGPAQLPPVTVTKVYRNVEYLKGEEKGWAPAVVGTRLVTKDSLRTYNNSYADMQLDPPNRFRLKENAVLKIERLEEEIKEPDGSVVKLTDLDLLKGELLARLDKLPSGTCLNLRSPVAIAAVRGTTFAVGVGDYPRTTQVAVFGDRVRVQSAGEPKKYVTLSPQQHTTVSPWDLAVLSARGTGVPPKKMIVKMLGDPNVPIKNAKELLGRLERPQPSLEHIVLGATSSVVAPKEIADSGEEEKWAVDEARYRAQRQIITKMEMIRLSKEETIGDLMNKDTAICGALMDYTLKANVVKEEYDKSGHCATVLLELPLQPVRKIIKRDISFAWNDIKAISLEDYAATFGGLIRVATERAARVDAYRRLAEKIYGTVIDVETTLENFAVKNDQVKMVVSGVVQGAEEVSKTYYSDGSIDTVLRIAGNNVRKGVAPLTGDVFGKNYMASPTAIHADEFFDLLQAKKL